MDEIVEKVMSAGGSFDVPIFEEVKVTPSVNNITRYGGVYIDFDPPVVAVPNDWQKMWDLAEREKMNFSDRISFENDLLDILDVRYIINSDEPSQQYFNWNLTRFNEAGMHIKLNFSDPILVSQSLEEDQIQIKLKKDFFLQAGKLVFAPKGRLLANYEEDLEYVTLIEKLPRQVLSEESGA